MTRKSGTLSGRWTPSGSLGGKLPLRLRAEPTLTHCAEEKWIGHWVAGGGAHNGINGAARTERCSAAFRQPFNDLARLKRSETIETSAVGAGLHFLAVTTTVPVRRIE